MPNRRWLLLASCLLTLLIGLSCLLPASQLPTFSFLSFLQWDKLVHLLLFYFLAGFWKATLRSRKTAMSQADSLLWIACLAYGIGIEYAQTAMNVGRSHEWADVAADALGAGLGLLWPGMSLAVLRLSKRHLPFVN